MTRRSRRTAETASPPAEGAAPEPRIEPGSAAARAAEAELGGNDGPSAAVSREERDAAERARMKAEIARKFARAAERTTGGWCRVTGSRARCDNPKCGIRGRGSLRAYRVAHSETVVDHVERTNPGGGVQHNTTQRTESHCTILCENCKLQQMVQEYSLAGALEDDRLPPRQDVVQLTGVQLDAERYERLRIMAMTERANPTDDVTVLAVEKRIKRERRANQADDLEPLPRNSIG